MRITVALPRQDIDSGSVSGTDEFPDLLGFLNVRDLPRRLVSGATAVGSFPGAENRNFPADEGGYSLSGDCLLFLMVPARHDAQRV
jgi:hypothetical protein